MTIATHTSGPWTYIYSPYLSQDDKEIPAFEIHGQEKVCDMNEDRPREEQEANARLIAAAPELLAALQNVRAAMNNGDDISMDEVISAINEAEG